MALASADPAGTKPATPVQSVQVLRGIAALAVVFYHTHIILAQPEYGSVSVLGQIATKGWLGVNLFFVLSGFIILYAHTKDIGQRSALTHYLWRRFIRLYPVYWLFLSAYVGAAWLGVGHPDFKWEPRHLISAYALIAVVDLPTLPLKIAWTLLFEVKFYLVFAVLLVSRRVGVITMSSWAAAILVRNAFPPVPDWGYLAPDWGFLHIWNIYFLVGMLACWLLPRFPVGLGPWLLAAGVAGLILLGLRVGATMAPTITSPALMLELAVVLGMVLLGSVLTERRYKWKLPDWAALLGDASYSIYLVHSAVISQLASLNARLFAERYPGPLVFGVTFAVATSAGIIAHVYLERPVLRRLRRVKVGSHLPGGPGRPYEVAVRLTELKNP